MYSNTHRGVCAILYIQNNCHFSIAMFGRKQTGKTSFLLMMLDRNDITIMDTFQNEDYYKVTFYNPAIGIVNIYEYIGFENDLSHLDGILLQLSSFIDQLDYVLYFAGSIKDISEFDRRFIQRLNEKDTVVYCIFNRHSAEEANKAQLYIEQGNLRTASFFCNCTNRFEVMKINDLLEQCAKDEVMLCDLTRFLMESPKTVLFLEPIRVGISAKNINLKYFQLFKAIADKNGVAIYMNKDRLKALLKQQPIQPDVLITGDKIILKVEDLNKYI